MAGLIKGVLNAMEFMDTLFNGFLNDMEFVPTCDSDVGFRPRAPAGRATSNCLGASLLPMALLLDSPLAQAIFPYKRSPRPPGLAFARPPLMTSQVTDVR